MEAFAISSSAVLFAKAHINKPVSPLKPLLGRSDICFSRSLNSNVPVRHNFLLRHKALQSVAPSQTEVLTAPETAGTGIRTTEPSETVHVQFQLHKECKFGESFFLVGNEPIVGQWSPSSAIPLNWSDGNIWTVELDAPTDIAIQYKFILKQSTGDISWQPGPDRILHTWNTKNTIAIAEDWEDAELQKISEVEITNQNEALLVNPCLGPNVPGNVALPGEESMLNVNKAANLSDKIASADEKPPVNSGNEFILEEKAIKSPDGTLLGIRKEIRVSDDGNCTMKEESISKINPTTLTSKTLPAYEEGPAQVPSLTPTKGVSSEDAQPKELAEPISSKEALPKELGKSISSEEAIPKELGKPLTSQEILPKELGKWMYSEEAIPKELGKTMSSQEAVPKEIGKSMSFEALPKELGKSISSKETLPKELGKPMSSEAAVPKELGNSVSSEAALPRELGKSISSEAALPKDLGQSVSSEAAQPKELGKSVYSEAAQPKELGKSVSFEAALPKELGKSVPSEAAPPKELGKPVPSEAAQPKELGKSVSSEAELPKELGNMMSSEAELPREPGKSITSDGAIRIDSTEKHSPC